MARRGENIYKRKDGRYKGRYIKHYDISGKAVYGYVYSRNYPEIKEPVAKYKTVKPPQHGSHCKYAFICSFLVDRHYSHPVSILSFRDISLFR